MHLRQQPGHDVNATSSAVNLLIGSTSREDRQVNLINLNYLRVCQDQGT